MRDDMGRISVILAAGQMWGVLLNSAIYLAGCFTAGIVTGNPWSWKLALAAAGVTYLGYNFQVMETLTADISRRAQLFKVRFGLVIGSIVLGAAAGLTLL